MIVYRAQQQEVKTAAYLEGIGRVFGRVERGGCTGHEHVTELLIGYGEFEAAAADLLSTDANLVHPTVTLLRQTSLLIGHLFHCFWGRAIHKAGHWAARFADAWEELGARFFPPVLPIRVPEGYAYYGLYPEAYLEAANRFCDEVKPCAVTCIGIRSIGTSLSTVVAAALEARGCHAESCTVRCRGHPFGRRLSLDPALEDRFRAGVHRHFLIVDEGPGLSGSSLCSVAQKLADLGVPDDRIVFFPSHDVDGATLLSQVGRAHWPRHRKYLVSFEDLWLKSGRLTSPLPCGELIDLSGGRWRPLFFPDESQYPAVQPWHERRKYLCLEHPAADTGQGASPARLSAALAHQKRLPLCSSSLASDATAEQCTPMPGRSTTPVFILPCSG